MGAIDLNLGFGSDGEVQCGGYVPPVGPRIGLKQNEKPRFLVSVDTEEEFDWSKPFDRMSNHTTSIANLPAFTNYLNGFGVKPVYLSDYPVLTHPQSRAVMTEMAQTGTCEIGAHLHPWVTPPHDEVVNRFNSFAGNLPEALERAKLEAITAAMMAVTRAPPLVFRAGRYGLGPNTHRIIKNLGYKIDSSVRPRYDYSLEGGPDYRSHPNWMWKTPEGLVEVPLTTARRGLLRRYLDISGEGRLPHTLARFRLLSRLPLTPEGIPVNEALEAIRVKLGEGVDVFCLSCHSPSASIGHTAFVQNKAELGTFFRWWEKVIELLIKRGAVPTTYGELLPALDMPA